MNSSSALIALFVVAAGTVHIAQPEFDAVDVALSFYMNGKLGWFLGLGLVSLGVGSLLLTRALYRAEGGRVSKSALVSLACWGAGCIVGGMFAPDPYGEWKRPPSAAGMAHSAAAMTAFVAFPCAAVLVSRRVGQVRGAEAMRWVAVLCAVSTVLLFACLAPVFRGRAPLAVGLAERVALGCYVVWLLMANEAVRSTGSDSAVRRQ